MKDESRHREMSEKCGARRKWSVKSLHSLESTGPLHHRHVLQTQTLSESHIYGFLLRFHQIGIGIESLADGACSQSSALSSPQSCRKFTPVATPLMILVTTSVTERFSSPLLWLVFRPMKDRKFQQFQQAWGMNQLRMKYAQ